MPSRLRTLGSDWGRAERHSSNRIPNSPGPSANIADELRDYLESRIDKWTRAGAPREEAVVQALDEFGNAARFAARFTAIARLKRRRFLMRLSLGSIGLLTAGLLMAFALWPESQALRGPAAAFAQEKQNVDKTAPDNSKAENRSGGDRDTRHRAETGPLQSDDAFAKERRSAAVFRLRHEPPLSSDIGRTPQVEAALEETVDFTIEPQSLREALKLLSTRFRIPILTDQTALEDANFDLSQEVKLSVSDITLHETLDLLLGLETHALDFQIRHGSLIVTTVEKVEADLQVVVYDCRDLALVSTLDHYVEPGVSRGAAGGGGMFQVQARPADPAVAARNAPQKSAPAVASAGESPANPPAAGQVPQVSGAPAQPANAAQKATTAESGPRLPIVQTIIAALGPDAWEEAAAITELGGLIVVRQHRLNHDKIKNLLADIRHMRASGAFASVEKEYEAEAKRRAEAESQKSTRRGKESDRPSPLTESNKAHPVEPRRAAATATKN
jgi:hypothetical protein